MGWVCAQPRTDPLELGGKKMHLPLTVGVIKSGGSNHRRAAGRSVGVESLENGENWRENGENPA